MNRTLALLTALLLPSLAALHAADAPPRPAKPIAEYVQPAPRSVRERVFDVWRNEGRFTKNPDIIELPSGRLVLVYSDTERHWSLEDQHLVLLVSDDQGKTWRKHGVVDSHDMRKGEERLVTPRLSRLKDGRLIVLIDQDDWGHFHEDQPPGIMCYWSSDDGATWTKPELLPVKGFEPDRVLDLPDGSLGFGAHLMRGESQEFANVLYCSVDGGKTWTERATMAHDGYHRFCEGGIVILEGGELACVLRENHVGGMPSFVVFSKDNGHTWSAPQSLPFSFHRPYAKQLADGRVLVTGRNTLGSLGTFGWVGDLHEAAGRYEAGGPPARFTAALDANERALLIENKSEEACTYTLLPPQSSKSEIVFEARLKVEGPAGVPVAALSIARVRNFSGPTILSIAADGVWLGGGSSPDERRPIDMTKYRDLAIRLRRGLMQVTVDGSVVLNSCVFWDSAVSSSWETGPQTKFGATGAVGKSFWQRVSYRVKNPTQPEFAWQWQASSGQWPDQYQRDRLIQIQPNPPAPKHFPDHGYSSWLTLKDGRILFVDYTNYGDAPDKSHLYGVYLTPDDLRDPPTKSPTESR
jgi:hypothetical protein